MMDVLTQYQQTGSHDALSKLIDEYINLGRHILRKMNVYDDLQDDYLQEFCIVIMKCADKYEKGSHATFATYVMTAMYNRFCELLARKSTIRIPRYLYQLMRDNALSKEAKMRLIHKMNTASLDHNIADDRPRDDGIAKSTCLAILSKMTEAEQLLLDRRFGLTKMAHSLSALATAYDTTKESARKGLEEALEKARRIAFETYRVSSLYEIIDPQ